LQNFPCLFGGDYIFHYFKSDIIQTLVDDCVFVDPFFMPLQQPPLG
jgi:hypothetical protein